MASIEAARHRYDSPGRGVPAWLLSAIFHVLLLVVLAISIQPSRKGHAETPDRKGEIVLKNPETPRTEYFTKEDQETSANSSQSVASVEKALPKLNSLNESIDSILPSNDDLGSIGEELSEGLDGAGDFLDGIADGPKQGKSHKTTTKVFGVEGTGTKFVYVFDRSGSMEEFGGRPLKAAKQQLIASIESLGPNQQFQIIFYNETPRAFAPRGGKARLLFATDENKKAARKFIASISGGGRTHHLSALKLGVDFGPDVVFFLTDAEDPIKSGKDLETIDRWNRNAASINAIEFGTGPSQSSNSFMKRIASENGGSYIYKNVTQFTE